MFDDDDMVMMSALQHYLFCPRQCSLIHVEQEWTENRLTAAGRVMHERVDEAGHETRGDVRSATALRLVSRKYGLIGVADSVEFHRVDSAADAEGVSIAITLPRAEGCWRPFPVEYKHGKPKSNRADEVQLCAQALCLEEMMGVMILNGALYYGKTRHRVDVKFDEKLRALTLETTAKVRELIRNDTKPPAVYGKHCESCSMIEECQPKRFSSVQSAAKWIDAQIKNATERA